MKLNLNISEQNSLLFAFSQLDKKEQVVAGVERGEKVVNVHYKLGGPARRLIAKNMSILRTSLTTYEEARKGLLREFWPEASEGDTIERDADPEKYNKFIKQQSDMVEEKEELDLTPLKSLILDGDEFPLEALAVLGQHGLIEEEPT